MTKPKANIANCDCQYDIRNRFIMCSMHKAAPHLLKAAIQGLSVLTLAQNHYQADARDKARKMLEAAIAKAEGK